MLIKCVECQHCKAMIEHYENVPKLFDTSLEFYCLKNNKYLGNMVKKKGISDDFPCFIKRKEDKFWS